MAEKNEIEATKRHLRELGDRLHSEVIFSKHFKETNRPDIEKEWMLGLNHACNYTLLLIRSFLNSIDEYEFIPSKQFSLYVGKIAIQHLLETINSFEQILNEFISENEPLRNIIEARINEKIEMLKNNWNVECNRRSKKLKNSLVNNFRNKMHEVAFIRDTLLRHKIIDQTDWNIWSFAWDIRNSMHRNFTAIKDIDFEYPDIRTGVKYHYKYEKGQELYHPGDFIAFYTITEQLGFILLKILQQFNSNNEAVEK